MGNIVNPGTHSKLRLKSIFLNYDLLYLYVATYQIRGEGQGDKRIEDWK